MRNPKQLLRADMTNLAGDRLRSFIERIERMEEEKKAIAEDVKEIYAEAKSNGFDPKIMRRVIALRRIEADKRDEESSLLDIYMHALSLINPDPTPGLPGRN